MDSPCGPVPQGRRRTVDCYICHHTYPSLLICSRCGARCEACQQAHAEAKLDRAQEAGTLHESVFHIYDQDTDGPLCGVEGRCIRHARLFAESNCRPCRVRYGYGDAPLFHARREPTMRMWCGVSTAEARQRGEQWSIPLCYGSMAAFEAELSCQQCYEQFHGRMTEMKTFSHALTTFHYHSDLRGNVHMVYQGSGGREDASIPGAALLAFVASYVRSRRINEMEHGSDAEILGLRDEDMP